MFYFSYCMLDLHFWRGKLWLVSYRIWLEWSSHLWTKRSHNSNEYFTFRQLRKYPKLFRYNVKGNMIIVTHTCTCTMIISVIYRETFRQDKTGLTIKLTSALRMLLHTSVNSPSVKGLCRELITLPYYYISHVIYKEPCYGPLITLNLHTCYAAL